MKKLASAQIVLGILIVVSSFLFVEYVIPGYYDEVMPVDNPTLAGVDTAALNHPPGSDWMIDSNGNVVGHIPGLHKPNVLMHIWELTYPAFGMGILGCSVAQYVQDRRKTTNTILPIIQSILGGLIVASLVVLIVWAEPHFEPYTRFIGGVGEVVIQKDPNWIVLQIAWKAVNFLLGLSVPGCGTAQLIKTRGKGKPQ